MNWLWIQISKFGEMMKKSTYGSKIPLGRHREFIFLKPTIGDSNFLKPTIGDSFFLKAAIGDTESLVFQITKIIKFLNFEFPNVFKSYKASSNL